MFFTPETLWTALVLVFWFWPMLLLAIYFIGASAWATTRARRGSGEHLSAHPATVPAPSGRS